MLLGLSLEMAVADSIRVVNDDYVKRIHSRNPSGHLHKGHGIVAATASIPSRYQTIVTDNSDKKGFLTKAKRFKYDAFMTEAPGPGNYVAISTMDNDSTSFSKKGTGGFASKTKKGLKYQLSSAPGPGIYGLPSMLRTRKDFNKSTTTSVFHKPIAQKTDKPSDLPAPNQYQVLKTKLGKANNVTADAAFKSQSKREVINVKDLAHNPAPGHYDVNDELLHDSAKVPLSSFKSKSKRQMQPDPAPVPGPGAYRPNEAVDPAKKQLFPRKHYLCISAPAMPLPQTPPLPGPGSYEMVDFEGPPKHYMSSAAFVSTTSRWTGAGRNIEQPGPEYCFSIVSHPLHLAFFTNIYRLIIDPPITESSPLSTMLLANGYRPNRGVVAMEITGVGGCFGDKLDHLFIVAERKADHPQLVTVG